jgi:hypothetical protein
MLNDERRYLNASDFNNKKVYYYFILILLIFI